MPVRLKDSFRPDLGKEVIEMLEDFCNSHHESNATEVVRKAVRAFIPRDLSLNEGARVAYEALQTNRRGAANSPSTGERQDGEQQR
jgi:hypothetical protein